MTGSKYDALPAYLDAQAGPRDRVEVTLDDIERALGLTLPPTARKDRVWWEMHKVRWMTQGWQLQSVFFKQAPPQVVFRRFTPAQRLPAEPAPRRKKYGPLTDFLKGRPPEQTQLALTMDAIEKILGQPLPATSRIDRTWWSNTEARLKPTEWEVAGWKVQSIYLKAQTVVFRRVETDDADDLNEFVTHLLEGRRTRLRPTAERGARWVRLCKLAGWYFEGVVLYEHWLVHESLSEKWQADVEEDYLACKRALHS